jgi:NTP pyrophosphatase (non-canonical NTP hydrolase)
MEDHKKLTILINAITAWGSLAQMDMAVEEASELIKAIQKLKRAKTPEEVKKCEEAIMDEVADVEIMCRQLGIMFDRARIEVIKNEKYLRIESRLNQSKP